MKTNPRKIQRARRRFAEAVKMAVTWLRFTEEVQQMRRMTIPERVRDLRFARQRIATAEARAKTLRRLGVRK